MCIRDSKDRGYGYLTLLIEGYHFAIPLRSSIKHSYCFRVNTSPLSEGVKGLDYTKALIVDSVYLDKTFVIDNAEYQRIFRNQSRIINDCSKIMKKFLLNIMELIDLQL